MKIDTSHSGGVTILAPKGKITLMRTAGDPAHDTTKNPAEGPGSLDFSLPQCYIRNPNERYCTFFSRP